MKTFKRRGEDDEEKEEDEKMTKKKKKKLENDLVEVKSAISTWASNIVHLQGCLTQKSLTKNQFSLDWEWTWI